MATSVLGSYTGNCCRKWSVVDFGARLVEDRDNSVCHHDGLAPEYGNYSFRDVSIGRLALRLARGICASIRPSPTSSLDGEGRSKEEDAPAPLLELREAIEVLGRRWLAAVHGRDADGLREILSGDYVAFLPNGELLAGWQAVDALVLPHQKAIEARAAKGTATDTFEMRVRIFSIELRTAVSIRHVRLTGAGEDAPAEWEYLNVYRKTGSRWRLSFSRLIHADALLVEVVR